MDLILIGTNARGAGAPARPGLGLLPWGRPCERAAKNLPIEAREQFARRLTNRGRQGTVGQEPRDR